MSRFVLGILVFLSIVGGVSYGITERSNSMHLFQWERLFVSRAAAQTNDPPVTSTTQITPTMTCTNKLDIMLVLDGSGSISANDFRQVRDFSSRLAESFTIGDNATRIGIVQFSDNAQLELPLSGDIAQVQAAIQQVQQIDGGTEIGAGITLAQSEIELMDAQMRHRYSFC